MDFNNLFGVPCVPQGDGWRLGECEYAPKSHTRIFVDTIDGTRDMPPPPLRKYMDAVEQGCGISTYFGDSVTLIWLIDAEGYFNLAIEEAYQDLNGFNTIPILKKNISGSKQWGKLGHPSMSTKPNGLARIGGEIRYIRYSGRNYWEINNDSGRYGKVDGREDQHLENVAAFLKTFDLDVEVDFT